MGMATLSLDCETTGLELRHGCRPFMVTAMNDSGDKWCWEWPVDINTRLPFVPSREIREINKVIKSHSESVFHNAKFDWLALALVGVDIPWMLRKHNWHDTLLASHVLESKGSHGLKDLALLHLDIRDTDEKELRKRIAKARAYARREFPDWNVGPDVDHGYWLPKAVWKEDTTCRDYALKDVERTLLLWLLFKDAMEEEGLTPQYERERKLLPVVYKMESRGITVLNSSLEREHKKYTTRALRHERAVISFAELCDYPDFNIRSYVQVKQFFSKVFRTYLPDTSAETLEQLYTELDDQGEPTPAANFLWHIIENRKNLTASKYLTNYKELKLVGEDGVYRLHPSMNQVGTDTTRFSHSKPNNANVGKGDDDDKDTGEEGDFKLRRVFGPAPGRVWYPIDYQQLQLRIVAHLANDKNMLRGFEQGYNFHIYMAMQIYGKVADQITKIEKRVAKAVNFGYWFGANERKVDASAGVTGIFQKVVELFPDARKYMDACIKDVRKKGYVKTAGGYRLTVPRDKAYVATNYIVQGTEGDIVKNAMIELDSFCDRYSGYYLESHAYMTMQVHDELVFDTPQLSLQRELDFLTGITTIMERAGSSLGIITPVSISKTTTNWHDAEELDLTQLRKSLPVSL